MVVADPLDVDAVLAQALKGRRIGLDAGDFDLARRKREARVYV